jgi:ERCC4-type nuclease
MLIVDLFETGMDRKLLEAGASVDDVTVQKLDFGDLIFSGQGPDGVCVVGFERKKLSDLVTSMLTRRLSGHQLSGMWRSFDFAFLVTEGIWRRGDGGCVEYPVGQGRWRPLYGQHNRRAVSYDQLSAYLQTLAMKFRSPETGEPLRVIRTAGMKETAQEYLAWHRWFQTPWDKHHSDDQLYIPEVAADGGSNQMCRRVGTTVSRKRRRVTFAVKAAGICGGVDRKAYDAAGFFKSGKAVANATVKEWMRVPGVGKKTAEAIVAEWEREEEVG